MILASRAFLYESFAVQLSALDSLPTSLHAEPAGDKELRNESQLNRAIGEV